MKNAAILLSLVILVSTHTPVGQLLKLPLLIEHFLKHQQKEDVSFFGFLKDHYSAGHNDADLPEDEELPFKNITFNSVGYAIVTPIIQTNLFVPPGSEKKISFHGAYSPQQHLASIFHPPQL